ncbi:MAG: AraC family ligand binding domain-containing protein, partial [Draconibacterium sp.]|nr:AraC family ligand binding domain-containing protein [Draconibacterium sp.]
MGNQFQKYLENNTAETPNNFLLEIFRIISFKPDFHFQMHSHKRIELNYILQGSCVMKLENELIKLNQNNSILIFPNSNHDFYVDSKSGVKIIQLEFQIDTEFTSSFTDIPKSEISFLLNLQTQSSSYLKIPNNREIGNCMDRIIKENKLKLTNFQSLSKLYFLELILLLSRYNYRQLATTKQQENEYVVKAMNIIHA